MQLGPTSTYAIVLVWLWCNVAGLEGRILSVIKKLIAVSEVVAMLCLTEARSSREITAGLYRPLFALESSQSSRSPAIKRRVPFSVSPK
jgi:hypothetical protein